MIACLFVLRPAKLIPDPSVCEVAKRRLSRVSPVESSIPAGRAFLQFEPSLNLIITIIHFDNFRSFKNCLNCYLFQKWPFRASCCSSWQSPSSSLKPFEFNYKRAARAVACHPSANQVTKVKQVLQTVNLARLVTRLWLFWVLIDDCQWFFSVLLSYRQKFAC